MNDELPTDFDLIVVGTGLSESIVAAAASRIGKKVLHVDSNDYYGDLWASFNLEGLQKFIIQCNSKLNVDQSNDATALSDGEKLVETNKLFSIIKSLEETWYIPKEAAVISDALQKCKLTQTESESQHEGSGDATSENIAAQEETEAELNTQQRVQSIKWTQDKVMKDYRKFNIDLAPKLLFSRGPLVELLISSNIARYAEFRNVSRILTWLDNKLEEVPCSKADVFVTKQVSVVEKRMLRKLVTEDILAEDKEWKPEDSKKTFYDFLASRQLTPNIIHYVLYAMSGGTKDTSFEEGLSRTRLFLQSLGRYGNTPFLWTMYGSGELPQCFCRLCAVFGGTYCLNRPIKNIIVSENEKCNGIIIGQQRISSPYVVMSVSKAPTEFLPAPESYGAVSHAVFINSKSIKETEKENLTLLRFPPIDDHYPCTVIEVGPTASACPQELYILHMFTKQQRTPKEDLEPYVKKLLRTEPAEPTINQYTQTDGADMLQGTDVLPQALWSLYYSVPDLSTVNLRSNTPNNVYLCGGPDLDLDFEFAVKQAKDIFKEIYPDEEFLPRAPDPEEIVLEGDEAEEANQNNQESGNVDLDNTGIEIGEEQTETESTE